MQLQMRHVKAGQLDSILLRLQTSLPDSIDSNVELPQLGSIFGSILHLNDPLEGFSKSLYPLFGTHQWCVYCCTFAQIVLMLFWHILVGAPQLVYGWLRYLVLVLVLLAPFLRVFPPSLSLQVRVVSWARSFVPSIPLALLLASWTSGPLPVTLSPPHYQLEPAT